MHYVSGQTIDEEPAKPVDMMELVKQVRGEGEYARQTDVEWMDAILKLRDEAINLGFSDPMAGFDTENNPLTDGKLATASKVYRGLSEMVDASQGNSYVFHNEYDRYVDDPITSVTASSKNKNIRRI